MLVGALIIVSICLIVSIISLVILIEDKNYYKQIASEWEDICKENMKIITRQEELNNDLLQLYECLDNYKNILKNKIKKPNFAEYLFIAPIEGQGAHMDGQEVLFRVFADNEGDAIEKLQKICATDKEFCDELCEYDELEIYAAYHTEDISPVDWLKGKVEDDFVE